MKLLKIKINHSQIDVADWLVDGIANLPQDEQIELWGRTYEDAPAKLSDGYIYIVNQSDVIDDIMFRLEVQYVEMARDHGIKEYNRQKKIVKKLSDMIRSINNQ